MEIHWPKNCLLVALERDGKEIIPRGKTKLMAGDRLTVMTDERDAGYIHDKLGKLMLYFILAEISKEFTI